MNVNTLIFDVGGVLIKNYDDTASDVQTCVGLPDDVFTSLWQEVIAEYGSGKIDEATLWKRLVEAGGNQVDTSENTFRKPFENSLVIYEKVFRLVRGLGEQGYQLAILSDTIDNHEAVLRKYGVYEPFGDNVFLSNHTGHRKPNPEAYQHALRALDIQDPSRALFIDDRQQNTEAAEALGLQALLVDGTQDDALEKLTQL